MTLGSYTGSKDSLKVVGGENVFSKVDKSLKTLSSAGSLST